MDSPVPITTNDFGPTWRSPDPSGAGTAALTLPVTTAFIILGPNSASDLLGLGTRASLYLGLGRTLGGSLALVTNSVLGCFFPAAATLESEGSNFLGLPPDLEVPRAEVPCKATAVAEAGGCHTNPRRAAPGLSVRGLTWSTDRRMNRRSPR